MAIAKFNLNIDPKTGEFTLEAVGQAGPSCLKNSQDIEAALGIVDGRTLKPSYRTTELTGAQQSITQTQKA